jgi:phospholipid/cholesterol/gamma-HCH transport system substrate-binding protein
MPVQYKGFTIGRIKSINFNMDDDRVDVQFSIFREYIDKVKHGSRVELVSSPISALGGNQFLFYPGRGLEKEPLPSGTLIPPVNSPESQNLPDKHLTTVPPREDGIGNIISQVGITLGILNEALGKGSRESQLGETVYGIKGTVANVEKLTEKISTELDIRSLMAELTPTIANLRELSAQIKEPSGSVAAFLNSEGDIYDNLVKILEGASGTLQQLEGTTGDIRLQTPQIAASLDNLLTALRSVNQVLESVKNNPLLKGGVPKPTESRAGGSSDRDMQF